MIACDFFTVETVLLRTIYVLFFIEIGTQRVHVDGCTSDPDSAWVTQQARNLTWDLHEQNTDFRYLIHDRDSKFAKSFDQVFEAEGCEVVLTPIQAPDANGYASYCTSCARFGANSESGYRRRSDSFLPWLLRGELASGGSYRQLPLLL